MARPTPDEEVALIKDTHNWPLFPLLPMKNIKHRKPGEFPPLGMMTAWGMENGVRVYHTSVDEFMRRMDQEMPDVLDWLDQNCSRYASVEEAVADGWVGD